MTKAFVDSDLAVVRRVLFRSPRYSLLLTGGASVWCGSLAVVVVILSLVGAVVLATQELIGGPPWIQVTSAGGLSLVIFCGCAWIIGLSAEDREKALGYLHLGWRQALCLLGSG